MHRLSRSLVVAAISAGTLILASSAVGKTVTRQHAHEYERAYTQVAQKFGHRAPGRNIVRWGFAAGQVSTDAQVVTSLGVLQRILVPAPQGFSPAASGASTSTGASSGLAACIISRESGGNPQATNGQYTGIAQWSPSSWAGGGGTQYAPTPLQASASQQIAVLNSMLANGQSGQWTPYDGC